MIELVLSTLKEVTGREFTAESMLLGGEIDSITLVTLIMELEQTLLEQGKPVRLVTDRAMSKNGPFKSVRSLAEYIQELAAE